MCYLLLVTCYLLVVTLVIVLCDFPVLFYSSQNFFSVVCIVLLHLYLSILYCEFFTLTDKEFNVEMYTCTYTYTMNVLHIHDIHIQ